MKRLRILDIMLKIMIIRIEILKTRIDKTEITRIETMTKIKKETQIIDTKREIKIIRKEIKKII